MIARAKTKSQVNLPIKNSLNFSIDHGLCDFHSLLFYRVCGVSHVGSRNPQSEFNLITFKR